MTPTPLLRTDDCGLFCAAGGFHIDPWKPVARAVISHGHGDHARPGSGAYLAAAASVPVLQRRLGAEARIEGVGFGERVVMGEVTVSFHPAGHILGSAQVRVERGGEVWVFSGDYKRGGRSYVRDVRAGAVPDVRSSRYKNYVYKVI
jgi:putative mRNA 3-end processing factor